MYQVDLTQTDWLRNSGWKSDKQNIILIHGYAGGDDSLPTVVLKDGNSGNGIALHWIYTNVLLIKPTLITATTTSSWSTGARCANRHATWRPFTIWSRLPNVWRFTLPSCADPAWRWPKRLASDTRWALICVDCWRITSTSALSGLLVSGSC